MEVLKLENGEYQTQLTKKYQQRKPYVAPRNVITAAIPGTIMTVMVKEGQHVKRGDALCILDSMKMNNTICATEDCVVSKVLVAAGESVAKDAVMFEFEDK